METIFDSLDTQQIRKYLFALERLRARPNVWLSLHALDDIISAGPRLTEFPSEWLDQLLVTCSRPRSSLAMRVEIRRTFRARHKAEAVDRGAVVKLEDSSSDESDGTESDARAAAGHVVVACTSHGDPDFPYHVPPSKLSHMLAGLTATTGRRGQQVHVVVQCFLRYRAVIIESRDDLLGAVSDSRRAGTARVGLSTASLHVTHEAQVFAQHAVDEGAVYHVAAYPAVAARKAGTGTKKVKLPGDGTAKEGAADGDLAIGGDAGGIDAGDVLMGNDTVDFATWMMSAPIIIRHTRLVDGVEMEDAGLPSVFRPGDSATQVTITRRQVRPDQQRSFPGPIRVSLMLGTTKCVTIDHGQGVLANTPDAVLKFTLRPGIPGRGAIEVHVTDVVTGNKMKEGYRTVSMEAAFSIPWDRKKPVILYHKGLIGDSILSDFGLEGVLDVVSPPISVRRMLSAPPHWTAALAKTSISEADIKAMEHRIFSDATRELKQRDTARGDVSDDELSSEDEADAVKPMYARFLDNKHMLSLGVDMRKPYKPAADSQSTFLMRVADRRPKRSRL